MDILPVIPAPTPSSRRLHRHPGTYTVIPAPTPSFRRKPESSAFAVVAARISCRICPRIGTETGAKQLRRRSYLDLSSRTCRCRPSAFAKSSLRPYVTRLVIPKCSLPTSGRSLSTFRCQPELTRPVGAYRWGHRPFRHRPARRGVSVGAKLTPAPAGSYLVSRGVSMRTRPFRRQLAATPSLTTGSGPPPTFQRPCP